MRFKIKFQKAQIYIFSVISPITNYLKKYYEVRIFFREPVSRCLLMVIEIFRHNPLKEQLHRRYLLSSKHCQKILTKTQQLFFLITLTLS